MTKKSVGADSIGEIPTGSKNKLIIQEKEFIYKRLGHYTLQQKLTQYHKSTLP